MNLKILIGFKSLGIQNIRLSAAGVLGALHLQRGGTS